MSEGEIKLHCLEKVSSLLYLHKYIHKNLQTYTTFLHFFVKHFGFQDVLKSNILFYINFVLLNTVPVYYESMFLG